MAKVQADAYIQLGHNMRTEYFRSLACAQLNGRASCSHCSGIMFLLQRQGIAGQGSQGATYAWVCKCCSCVAMLADLYYAESACGAATVGSSEVSSFRTQR